MSSPEPEPNLIALFARPLHEADIRYLIAGSVGSMHYSLRGQELILDIFVGKLAPLAHYCPVISQTAQAD